MKLYLPHPDLARSARCFDDETLEHQITNAVMVVHALVDASQKSKLLCVGMWRGYSGFLLMYLRKLCTEAGLRRGWTGDATSPDDNPYIEAYVRLSNAFLSLAPLAPKWYGLARLHRSHQSELIKNDPYWYGQQFPTTPLDMPYLWPVNTPGHYDYTLRLSLADADAVKRGELVLRPKDSEGVPICAS